MSLRSGVFLSLLRAGFSGSFFVAFFLLLPPLSLFSFSHPSPLLALLLLCSLIDNKNRNQRRYIAMQASMASGVVDICLIPEVPFTIPKLCAAVEAVLDRQGDCVVCVAEGAGQDLARHGGGNGHGAGTDASGNPILEDVGAFLKSAFKQGVPGCDCKYIGEFRVVLGGHERERERERERDRERQDRERGERGLWKLFFKQKRATQKTLERAPTLKHTTYQIRTNSRDFLHLPSKTQKISSRSSSPDPTYMIRAIPTNSADRIYCKILGQGAVHGAFAGYTDFTVGLVNTHYVYLPIPVIIQAPRVVDPQGRQWNRLKTAIKQPDLI